MKTLPLKLLVRISWISNLETKGTDWIIQKSQKRKFIPLICMDSGLISTRVQINKHNLKPSKEKPYSWASTHLNLWIKVKNAFSVIWPYFSLMDSISEYKYFGKSSTSWESWFYQWSVCTVGNCHRHQFVCIMIV